MPKLGGDEMTQTQAPAQAVSTAGRVVNGSVIGLASMTAGNYVGNASGSPELGMLGAGLLGIFLSVLSAGARQRLESAGSSPPSFWQMILLQTAARVG